MPRAVDVPPPSSNDLKALQRAVQLLNAQVRALQQQIDAILRRLGVVVLVVVLCGACQAQTATPTLTPTATGTVTQTGTITPTATVAPCITFRVGLSDPNTNPPSQAWGKDVVHKINQRIFASQCGGSSSGGGAGSGCGTDAAVCADSGNGDRGTVTIAPNCGPPCCNVELTVNDADGCEVTVDETGAVEGSVAYIVNTSANYARFATQAGVFDDAHGVSYLNPNYTLVMKYDDGQWHHANVNDPTSIYLSLLDWTDFADLTTFPAANECALICSTTILGQNPEFATVGGCQIVCPSPMGQKNVQFREDPCLCTDINGAVSVGASQDTGTNAACIGPNANCAGTNALAMAPNSCARGLGAVMIGPVNTTTMNGCADGEKAIVVGFQDAATGKATAEGAIHLGINMGWHTGLASACYGGLTTCTGDYGSASGYNATCAEPYGIASGYQAYCEQQNYTFGSIVFPLHPVWPGNTSTAVSNCGTGASLSSTSGDVEGLITVGSTLATTSCQVDFGREWDMVPRCYATNRTSLQYMRAVASTTALVIDSAIAFENDEVEYGCAVSGQGATHTPTATPTTTPTATP